MPVTTQAIHNADSLQIRIDRLHYLDGMLNKWAADSIRPTIVTKVLRHGVPIFEGTYGTMNRENAKLEIDTIFPVASITKSVIAALILCMHDDGLLDIADSIVSYLPEMENGGKNEILLWYFLTHTSGLTDEEIHTYFHKTLEEKYDIPPMHENATSEEWDARQKRIAEKLKIDPNQKDLSSIIWDTIINQMPMIRKPRSQMVYCSYGYQKLADIIGRVSGESLDVYAGRKLFGPLGMVDSHWILPKEKWSRVVGRSEGYAGYPWMMLEDSHTNESGSGGLKTTVTDMVRFTEMIRNGGILDNTRVLSKAAVREMVKNHNAGFPDEFDSWALGWDYRGTKKDDSGVFRSAQAIDHGGYAGTKIMIDPEYGMSYAFFSVEPSGACSVCNLYAKFTNMLLAAMD